MSKLYIVRIQNNTTVLWALLLEAKSLYRFGIEVSVDLIYDL